MARKKQPAPGSRRPRRIPPPLRSAGEPFEGALVLEELSGALAMLVWKTIRSVELWAELPEEDRAEAFTPGAHEQRMDAIRRAEMETGVREALGSAAGVLGRAAEAQEVADACRRLADWAVEHGAIQTALSCAQAGAVTLPESSELAFEVGRLARKAGDPARAETWFRQAIGAGRARRDWLRYGDAYLALANVLNDRGNFPGCRRAALRALHTAQRYHLRDLEGRAYHDLAGLAVTTGSDDQVNEYGRSALEAYGPDHPRLPFLASDLAYHWMVRGYFATALRVFLALDAYFETPRDRLFLYANLGRAAAGAGEEEVFRRAWRDVNRLAIHPQAASGTAMALLDLAHGAAHLGDLDLARDGAERVMELAGLQGLGRLRLEAEAILDAIAGGRTVRLASDPAGHAGPAEPGAAPAPVDSLAEMLTAAL